MILVISSLKEFFNYRLYANESGSIVVTTGVVVAVVVVFILTWFLLRILRRIITRKLPQEDKKKFSSVFSFAKWFIYTVVILITFDNVGINVTTIFAASAALLVGVGLALQTFFQDIISGIFILLDRTVSVADIIEIEDKVGRVESIHLRTTRAVTIDNKVLVIPNHKFLTSSVYNWTQNGSATRENITVGVAYGSDTEKVKELLIQAALEVPTTINEPPPLVLFTNFGDSALEFKLVFTVTDSFNAAIPKSDVRFKVDQLFREQGIKIPFPQRDIHLFNQDSQ